jgi:hypothetical protein
MSASRSDFGDAGARMKSDAWGRWLARLVEVLTAASRPRVEVFSPPRGARVTRAVATVSPSTLAECGAKYANCCSCETVYGDCISSAGWPPAVHFFARMLGNRLAGGVRLSGTLRRGHGSTRPGGAGGTVASVLVGCFHEGCGPCAVTCNCRGAPRENPSRPMPAVCRCSARLLVTGDTSRRRPSR